jgi:hypothetical protein
MPVNALPVPTDSQPLHSQLADDPCLYLRSACHTPFLMPRPDYHARSAQVRPLKKLA